DTREVVRFYQFSKSRPHNHAVCLLVSLDALSKRIEVASCSGVPRNDLSLLGGHPIAASGPNQGRTTSSDDPTHTTSSLMLQARPSFRKSYRPTWPLPWFQGNWQLTPKPKRAACSPVRLNFHSQARH